MKQSNDDATNIEDIKAMDFSEDNGGAFGGSREIAQQLSDEGVTVNPEFLPAQPAPGGNQPSMEAQLAANTVAMGSMGPAGFASVGIKPPTPSGPSGNNNDS